MKIKGENMNDLIRTAMTGAVLGGGFWAVDQLLSMAGISDLGLLAMPVIGIVLVYLGRQTGTLSVSQKVI